MIRSRLNLAGALLVVAAFLPLVTGAAESIRSDARKVSFDAEWRFFKGDAQGAEQPGFDDSMWRRLSVPHDWSI
ncbi:MAG TPA: hypothetical protein PLH97_03110 [Verrucomicrobiota bacterium]|nr:hypothetical protein [Verrucomicrobiota bacterium]